jgi:ribosome biogenesis GTPase A
MRPRYSFSSRHTGKIRNLRKQKGKYPSLARKIVQDSDIILEILDARFPKETRNKDIEDEIKKKKKRVIYVLNKADLIDKSHLNIPQDLAPYVLVSSTLRKGIKELRDRVKMEARKVEKERGKEKEETASQKVTVGVIGYPNTGKSSLINTLIGKSSAGVGSDAGFTKSIQKLKLSQDIVLIDSPGIIPAKEYSPQDQEKLALNTKLGARSYSQIKEPEIVVTKLIRDYPNVLEHFYKIDAKGDPEILLEELGKRKGFLKKGGEVNEDTTARLVIKDWQTGKIKL